MRGGFLTTRWSVILTARGDATLQSRDSLARLCEMYWPPVYAYVRRRVGTAEDAEDLTQEFFTTFVAKQYVSAADPARGRFRSFLLSSVQHFLCNQWDRRNAKKRGGGARDLSLDTTTSGRDAESLAATALTPEAIFEERWAATLVHGALDRLRQEQDGAGKRDMFEALLPLMCERGADSYAHAAEQLHTSAGALRVVVHRLRRRYRSLLLEEIADTVTDAADVTSEVQYLLRALEGARTSDGRR